jgi:hypothetical protein
VEKNQLYYGDNLAVLREHIKDESVDLIWQRRQRRSRLRSPGLGTTTKVRFSFRQAGLRPAGQPRAAVPT